MVNKIIDVVVDALSLFMGLVSVCTVYNCIVSGFYDWSLVAAAFIAIGCFYNVVKR